MKKNIIALAILTTVSSAAVASNAVLNVEGQIQINGETVIGSDGKVLASALPDSSVVTVDLNSYRAAHGKYTFQYFNERYMTNDGSGWVRYETICTEVDNFISDTEYEFTNSCVDQDGFVTSNYKEIWKDNGDGSETVTWVNYWDDEETRESETRKIEVLSDYAATVTLGQTTGYTEKATVLETEGFWNQVGDNWFFSRTKSVLSLIDSVKVGDNTFNDCVLVQRDGYWQGATALDIHCSGIGLVVKTIDQEWAMEYQLVSYEQSEASTARALNTAASYKNEALGERARQRLAALQQSK